jgi:hypothetical protein
MYTSKPTLCLDFDGVLYDNRTGWESDMNVSGGPVPGAMQFLRDAVERFWVTIYSTRSGSQHGRNVMEGAIRRWLIQEHGEVIGRVVYGMLDFPPSKPAAFVSLDDRALTFTGTFPSLDTLLAFNPWNVEPAESESPDD